MASTETTLAHSVLQHLLFIDQWQPNYAKNAALNFARIDPYQLAEIPAMLTAALRQKQITRLRFALIAVSARRSA